MKAVYALSRNHPVEALEPLIAVLADRDEYVRMAAARAFGQIARNGLRERRTIEPLIVALADVSSKVRELSEEALHAIDEYWEKSAEASNATPRLIALLGAGPTRENWEARNAAVKVLARIGDVRAIEPLIAKANESAGSKTDPATAALGTFGERAVEPLIAAVASGRLSESAAANALGLMGDPAVVYMIGALNHDDSKVRCAAAAALGYINNPAAVEPLILALSDPNHWVTGAAAFALGCIGDPRAIEPLLINSEYPGISLVALETALDSIDALWRKSQAARAAVPKLLAALPYDKSYSVWALGEIGDPRAIEPLIVALRSKTDSGLRAGAARALGQIGDPRAVGPLGVALGDVVPHVGRFAKLALDAIAQRKRG